MNRRLVDHVCPLIPVRLYGKPDVAVGHAVQLLPNVQAFFPTRLRVELCSLGPIIVGGGHCRSPKGYRFTPKRNDRSYVPIGKVLVKAYRDFKAWAVDRFRRQYVRLKQ